MEGKDPKKGSAPSTSPKKTPTSPKKSPKRVGTEKIKNDGIKKPTSNPGPEQRRRSQNTQRLSIDSSKLEDMKRNWKETRGNSQDPRKPSIDSPYGNPENQNLNMSGNIAHKKHESSEYVPGTIFSVRVFEHDMGRIAPDGIKRAPFGATGLIVFSEFVKFVVIAQFYDHCVALPLHTHQGKGLTYKTAFKNDFIPVRIQGSDYQNTDNNYSILDIILDPIPPGKENTWSHVITDNTHVHFTAPYSHSILVKSQFLGRLTEDSLRTLKMLYGQSVLFKLGMERYESGELRNLLKIEHKHFTVPPPNTTRLGPQVYIDTKPEK